MNTQPRRGLLVVLLSVIAGVAAWGLATPHMSEVAQAAAPAPPRQDHRTIRRESLPPTDSGRAPITGPASALNPLSVAPLGGPVFGENYRANTDTQSPNLAQQEPSIAINPTDPLNVVAMAKDERQGTNTKHDYIYTSTDGGVTWLNQRFPYRVGVPPSSSDPVVNFSDDGVAYVTSLVIGGSAPGIQLARSTDKGITFGNTTQVTAGTGSDKEWTWIDNFPSSPYYHRIYVAWRNFGGGPAITLNYSSDRGQTWSSNIGVTENAYQFPMPVALPNGQVLVSYIDGGGSLAVSRSTNGGATFGSEQSITPITDPNCPPDNPGCSIWRLPPIPSTAVSPLTGSVVSMWSDGRNGTANIYAVRGTNNGTQWSAPVNVAPVGSIPGTYQIQPWVEADDDGSFHAIWYDNRMNPNTSIFNTYYSRSTDDGQTWSGPAAMRISTASTDLRIGIPGSYNLAAGDYIQVTAHSGNVYAAWTDTRSGTGEDIYVVRGQYPSADGTPSPTTTPCVPPAAAWNIVTSQNPSQQSNYLRDVSALSSSDVWAVGYSTFGTGMAAVDKTLIQRWNGTQWNAIPSPNVGSSSNRLSGVEAISANDVWAVGQFRFVTQPDPYDQTLILHWDGTAWSVVNSPNPGTWNHNLYDIQAVSPTDVWAVGEYTPSLGEQTRTLIQRWNGTAWSTVASPQGNVASYNSLRGVTVVAANDVWAGGYFGVVNGSQTLTLRWDGTQWNVVPSANGMGQFSQLRAIDAVSANDIWAVGYNNPQPGGTGNYIRSLIIRWNGTQWSQVPSPNPIIGASNYFNGVTAISASDVWAVGYHCTAPTGSCSARTFTAHWDGAAWTEVASPNNDASFHELYATDAASSSDVWATGYNGPVAGVRTLVLRYFSPPCATPSVTATAMATATRTATSIPTNTATMTATRTNTPTLTSAPTQTPPIIVGTNTPTRIATGTAVPPTSTPSVAPSTPTATPVAVTPTGTSVPATATGTLAVPTGTPTIAPCTLQFSDVPADNTFYANIRCLACKGILGGYSDGTFRPNNNITRGQIAKVVSNAAGYADAPGTPIFADVLANNIFFEWVQRLARRGHMGGYPCGQASGEPCGTGNLPYFRTFANATRGQLAKIVSNAALFSEPQSGQTFTDVPTDNSFHLWIERLASRGVMGGYGCGRPSEPCDDQNRPYFRPNNDVTRGQASKIVANTFFPSCP